MDQINIVLQIRQPCFILLLTFLFLEVHTRHLSIEEDGRPLSNVQDMSFPRPSRRGPLSKNIVFAKPRFLYLS
jgi:hypothetical protein